MSAAEHLQDFFQQQSPRMAALADSIWSLAELRYAETASAQLHIQALEQAGFRITRNVAGIPTAFLAEWGEEGPVLAFLGEYDALSGLNSKAAPWCARRPPTARAWPAMAAATICWALRRISQPSRCRSICAAAGARRACATTDARPRKAAPARPSWRAPACSTTWTRR
jgi:hypothetical protein